MDVLISLSPMPASHSVSLQTRGIATQIVVDSS